VSVTLLPGPADQPEDDSGPASATTAALSSAARPSAPPVIELRGLRLRGIDLPADLDLMVRHGELITLTGTPKSGRSALLNVLGLVDRPAAGRYLLDGTDTARLRDADRVALRTRQIGMVFAHKNLLPGRSVLDNVTLPLVYAGVRRRPRIAAGLDVLSRVRLTALSKRPASQLSSGQQAMCAVGRALITRPGLLLCDDPTAGLDEAEAEQVIGLLTDLHREGRTVLIATADQLAAAYSSRSVQIGVPIDAAEIGPR
jgi:putative ABC transport system ATP-binding protein